MGEGAMGKARGGPRYSGRMRVAAAKRKVTRGERATYDRCHAAMLAGTIYAWSIDDRAGCWLVKVVESEEWRSLDVAGVESLLAELAGTTWTAPVAAARVRRPVIAAPTAAEAVIAEAVAVVDESYRDATSDLPGVLAEYVARLVHLPKRAYADQYCRHVAHGDDRPDDPAAEWGAKVRAKVDRLAGRVLVDA